MQEEKSSRQLGYIITSISSEYMLVLHILFHLIPPKMKGLCTQEQDLNIALKPKLLIFYSASMGLATGRKIRY